jgi:hypothetical protein
VTVSPILISPCSARGSRGRCRLPRISASFSPLPRSHTASPSVLASDRRNAVVLARTCQNQSCGGYHYVSAAELGSIVLERPLALPNRCRLVSVSERGLKGCARRG